jgi:preprotein translocase subunit SecA
MLAVGTRQMPLPKGLDALADHLNARVQSWRPRTRRLLRRAEGILQQHRAISDLAESRLRERIAALRDRFRLGRDAEADTDAALSLLCEVCVRHLGLLPHREQIAAALAMRAGCLAELATGEGKTLVAALVATLAGWRGRGCHVITVNDYLVQRDAAWMADVYGFCGLSVGCVQQDMTPDARRGAYAADVTYVTNKEVTADFLRDRLLLGRLRGLTAALTAGIAESDGRSRRIERLVMRGLAHAVIDEADALLVDEAVTPLIISGEAPNPEQATTYQQAAAVAAQLQPKDDYRVIERFRDVELTRSGRRRVGEMTADLGGLWRGVRRREELIAQALIARELFLRDKHYVVQEDKVVIVDEFTGRLMPDRTWRDGLHQAIEAKERIEVNPPKATLARLSFQRFFRMYPHLCGMTGTAWEVRHETWRVYRMPVARIPTHRPCIRVHHGDKVHAGSASKWAAVVDRIAALHEQGRPVLVGTRSIAASEALSVMLTQRGLEHQVLNAVRQAEEAQIVADAGHRGRITVATNMAGRGTDIKLGSGVADRGGLHVLATERHESGRIDRQLFGRCARQGDPGSSEAFVSLDDELVRRYLPNVLVRLLAWTLARPTSWTERIGRGVLWYAQHRAEAMARRQRAQVLKTDDWLDQMLGFAGRER